MELMIIVVVATIGTAMVVGWMGSIEEPNSLGSIECDLPSVMVTGDKTTGISFNVTVYDAHGDVVPDAVVTLSGCNVSVPNVLHSPTENTDHRGIAAFKNLTVNKTTSGVGYITITVSAQDLGESTIKLPVVR